MTMRPEHVRLQQAECLFGEKNLLHAQLDVISLLKRYDSYRALRSQEMLLKISLKTKLAEARDSLAFFEKLLPKPAIMPKAQKQHQEHDPDHGAHNKRQTLQDEVEEIRRKLAALH